MPPEENKAEEQKVDGKVGAILFGIAHGLSGISSSWGKAPGAVKILVSFVLVCVLGVPAFALVWTTVHSAKKEPTTSSSFVTSGGPGSLVVHPGAAASFSQSGGITAGQIMLGQPSRHIDDRLRDEIKSKIPIDRKVSIEVIQGDQEAFQYATEIHDFLERQRYDVMKISTVSCDKPQFGQGLVTGTDPTVLRIGSRQSPTSIDPQSLQSPKCDP
jgi:hypothetical protein